MLNKEATLSSDSILSRIGLSREFEELEQYDEYDAQAEYRAFATSRTPRRVEAMLDLVFRTGTHMSLSYPHLYQVTFDPSCGLVLNFTDHMVTITGQQLGELFRHLKNHRVSYVCEADEPTSKLVATKDAVVTGIIVTKKDEASVAL